MRCGTHGARRTLVRVAYRARPAPAGGARRRAWRGRGGAADDPGEAGGRDRGGGSPACASGPPWWAVGSRPGRGWVAGIAVRAWLPIQPEPVSEPLRVLIADDQALVRGGLSHDRSRPRRICGSWRRRPTDEAAVRCARHTLSGRGADGCPHAGAGRDRGNPPHPDRSRGLAGASPRPATRAQTT